MQDRGLDPETRLIGARPESAGEVVAAALGIEPGSPTLYVERLRVAGGEPLLLEQVHLPAERFPGLLASDLEHGSLYDLLTVRYGTRIVRAREALEPVLLRAREARLLGQRPRRPGPPDRGNRLRRRRRARRVRPELRPRRPDPLLRRAGRRPGQLADRPRDRRSRGACRLSTREPRTLARSDDRRRRRPTASTG